MNHTRWVSGNVAIGKRVLVQWKVEMKTQTGTNKHKFVNKVKAR